MIPSHFVWTRLMPLDFLGGAVGIFTTESEWINQGINPKSLGLLAPTPFTYEPDLEDSKVQVPHFDDLSLDLHTPGAVRVLRIPPDTLTLNPDVLVEGIFSDPHPKEWVEQLRKDRQCILAVGPYGSSEYQNEDRWMETWWLGVISVARQFSSTGLDIV